MRIITAKFMKENWDQFKPFCPDGRKKTINAVKYGSHVFKNKGTTVNAPDWAWAENAEIQMMAEATGTTINIQNSETQEITRLGKGPVQVTMLYTIQPESTMTQW